jgi:hypothetical protein
MPISDTTAICVNDGCARLFDYRHEGWEGACDQCAAATEDHRLGRHRSARPDCRACG